MTEEGNPEVIQKRKVGRPRAKYEDWMPEKVFEVLSQGLGQASICAALGIKRKKTLRQMLERHPELKDAYESGCMVREARDEALMEDMMVNPDKYKSLKEKVFFMRCHNMHKWDLVPKTNTETKQVHIENMNTINAPQLSNDQLMRRIQELSADPEVVKALENDKDSE
jgi:hypothetical protein